MKRYKLIRQASENAWEEENGAAMKIGRIVSENEIINERPMSYWIKGQEEYWEEIFEESTKALRYNDGKPQWSLVHFKSLEPFVKVLEFGAQKYDRDNWKKDTELEKILDSTQRHLAKMIDGENLDQESGLEHAGHVICNMMFYIYHYNK